MTVLDFVKKASLNLSNMSQIAFKHSTTTVCDKVTPSCCGALSQSGLGPVTTSRICTVSAVHYTYIRYYTNSTDSSGEMVVAQSEAQRRKTSRNRGTLLHFSSVLVLQKYGGRDSLPSTTILYRQISLTALYSGAVVLP